MSASGKLVFTGFMGAGKSTAARAADRHALDTDRLVEQRVGMTVQEYFDRHGEAAFRAQEERTVLEALAHPHAGAVALGGGALGSEAVRAALGEHRLVALDADAELCWTRVRGGHSGAPARPLARDRARFVALHAQRAAVYEGLADAIVPAELARDLDAVLPALRALPQGSRLLWARAASGQYPVYIGHGLLGREAIRPAGRRFVVSDETVAARWAATLGAHDALITIPPGEPSKTLQTAERVWRELARAGMTRADQVVALGGGVVGDLAGFCAATYQRGVRVVQAPTTLMAQVDSAIGGKTGVDLPEAKNYVGAYHQPAAVIADLDALGTLPDAEVAAGYAEVVKTALLAGGALWERVRHGAEPTDAAVVAGCALTKLRVVAADERDTGARQALNLGHTVAHALETVTGYTRLRHGEAVAQGLLVALRLSGLGGLREEVARLLAARGLALRVDGVDVGAVLAAVGLDKKRLGAGAVPFVLLEAPGAAQVGQPVPPDALCAAVEELLG